MGEHLAHVFRQVAGHHLLEADFVEDVTQAGSHGHPDGLQVLGGRFVGGRFRADSAHFGERTLQATKDLAYRDLRRRPSELVAALVAPLAGDDADATKLVQNGSQEAYGEALSIGELLCGERFTVSGSEGTEGSKGIFDPGRDVHTSIQPELCALVRVGGVEVSSVVDHEVRIDHLEVVAPSTPHGLAVGVQLTIDGRPVGVAGVVHVA